MKLIALAKRFMQVEKLIEIGGEMHQNVHEYFCTDEFLAFCYGLSKFCNLSPGELQGLGEEKASNIYREIFYFKL